MWERKIEGLDKIMAKERKGKERKGKEREGNERKGKETCSDGPNGLISKHNLGPIFNSTSNGLDYRLKGKGVNNNKRMESEKGNLVPRQPQEPFQLLFLQASRQCKQ